MTVVGVLPAHADDVEPAGDPNYTVVTDPVTGYRLYTPLNLVYVDAVPRPHVQLVTVGVVDAYSETLQTTCPCPIGTLGASKDEEVTYAPFNYGFEFKRHLFSRDFYIRNSAVCVDQASAAEATDDSQPVTYFVSLNDDHGSYGVVVAGTRFTANSGMQGLCWSDIDTSNRYNLTFGNPRNNDGVIYGGGNVDHS